LDPELEKKYTKSNAVAKIRMTKEETEEREMDQLGPLDYNYS
jgi:hypothetical protein